MKYALLAGGIIVACLCSSGCSHPPKRTALHDFGIEEPLAGQTNQAIIKPMISVDAPTWLWDNRIRFRLLYAAPTRVRFYGLDLWIASPPELFEQYLFTSGSSQKYPLVIRLLDFEQQFETPEQARVVLRFSVQAYSADHQRQLGAQSFSLQLPTKTPNAEGAIEGFKAVIQLAAINIQQWLTGLNAGTVN